MPLETPKPARWWPGIRSGHPLAVGLSSVWMLWEGGGITCHNLIDDRYHGTFDTITDSAWTLTEIGWAVDYANTGTIDCGLCPGITNEVDVLTMASWHYKRSGDSSRAGAFAQRQHHGGEGIVGLGHWQSNNITANIYTGTQDSDAFSISSSYADQWVHTAFVYDGATLEAFVNGIGSGSPTSVTGTITTANRSLQLGLGITYGVVMDGLGGCVMVWDRALSRSDILWLYNEPWSVATRRKRVYSYAASTASPSPTIDYNLTQIGSALLRRRVGLRRLLRRSI